MSSNRSVYDDSMMALRLLFEPLAMCVLRIVTNVWAAFGELLAGKAKHLPSKPVFL